MRNAIPFKGRHETIWLTSGSQAHKLATEGKAKELAAHMKEVEGRHDALVGEATPITLEQWNSLGGKP